MVSKEHVLDIERETLKFRLLALLGIAVALYFDKKAEVVLLPTSILVAGYLVYTLLLRSFLLPRLYFSYLIYLMILIDVAAATAALYLFGLGNYILILFPLLIIYHAIYLGYLGGLVSATLLSLAYGGLPLIKGTTIGTAVSFQVPLFYLVALFTGYLSHQRFKERNAKLTLQEIVRAESGARNLLELAKTLHQSLDTDAVLHNIVRLASNLTGIPGCVIFLIDEKRQALVAKATNIELKRFGVEDLGEVVEPIGEGTAASLLLEKGQPQALQGELPPWARYFPFASLIAAPLIWWDNPLGMIYLLDYYSRRSFTPAEMRQAKSLADMATIAISNAQLYAQAEDRSSHLLSELRSTVQRMGRLRQSQGKPPIKTDRLNIDPTTGAVEVLGKPVQLSATEFGVLHLLAERAGNPINQETLLREIWGEDFRGQGNVVDVCIHRLRRKLAVEPAARDIIRTVRGSGYMFPLEGS